MKRIIWFRDGALVAKIGWINETDQGVYIGPSGALKTLHYSYHQDGRRHLTNAKGRHFSRTGVNDTALHTIRDHRNVGGFSVEPSELVWMKPSVLRKDDLFLAYDRLMRSDLPLLVSLHLCTPSHLPTFVASIRSAGAGHKDAHEEFALTLFPHLKGIFHLQYHTAP